MSGFDGYKCLGLLKNQTADETTSQWVDVRGRTHLVFIITGTGTTSSGVVTLEEMLPLYSPTDPKEQQEYSGTASAITTVNASSVTGDNQSAIHAAVGAYSWVRARISTAIGGGGSISVGLVAV